jgi:hypothetical protein
LTILSELNFQGLVFRIEGSGPPDQDALWAQFQEIGESLPFMEKDSKLRKLTDGNLQTEHTKERVSAVFLC